MAQKVYHTLTAHGQARRLRRLVFSALTQYDLDVNRLSVFQVRLMPSSPHAPWIWRILPCKI